MLYLPRMSVRLRSNPGSALPWLAVFLLLVMVGRSAADDFEQWLKNEKDLATTKLFANIKANGAVIASPYRRFIPALTRCLPGI